MAQSVITSAFERLKAQEAAGGNRILIDHFVFANVPGLNVAMTPSTDDVMPPAAQIVHRQNIDRNGMVNENTVAYSVLLPESTGDFTFNWLGLVSSATNTLCMVVYLQPQRKIKTADGKQGNTLIYSEIMEYAGASAATGITTPVSTWQIDFTARLHGMDEATRKAALDIYGPGLFFDDAFKLTAKGIGQATFAPGIAYLRGLRVELETTGTLTFATGKAQTVYLDAALTGTLTGENKATFSLTSQKTADYIDSLNQAHYIEPVATISASGVITDIRKTRKKITEHIDSLGNEFLVKKKNLSDLPDVQKALESLTIDHIKKAVEDTQIGLSKLPTFRPETEDDLDALPVGFIGECRNKAPGGPLPTEVWCYIQKTGNLDNRTDNPKRKGGAIRLTCIHNAGEVWTGVKSVFDDDSVNPENYTWTRDFNTLNKPTPEDVGLADTKKAVDDTQIGLSAQSLMLVNSADDLSNLLVGAQRFAQNAPGKEILPTKYGFHITVLGKSRLGNGSSIIAAGYGNSATYWIGRRTEPAIDADWTWTPLIQTIDNLNLTDTVAKASGALQKNQNGADIPNKPLFVKTLGIVDSYPVGCPIPYPGPVAPDGYLLMDGRPFSKILYPQLAKLYVDGVLPDMRGMFVRGWDNGRLLDTPNGYDGGYGTANGLYTLRGYKLTSGNSEGERGLLQPQYLDSVISDREPDTNRLLHLDHYGSPGFPQTVPSGPYQEYVRDLEYRPSASGISFYRRTATGSFIPDYKNNGMVRLGSPNVAFNYITKAA
ncbi:hypothetical protein AA471_11285 [Salmonella enterica subsp. enterica]|nr:hypothetical protein [Salmonella enterica subsp. enterica]EDQ2988647.1 hypothetical protein [Salmonella enterica subsp. enterica]